MRFTLDHLAIAAATLEEGVAWAEAHLGVPFGPGGSHARFGTHNRLIGMAGALYLEVIAPEPITHVDGPRWFDLDNFSGPPRLANWICRVDDLDAAIARFPMAGRAVDLSRGDLRWRMAVPEDGSLPMHGAFPTLIQWQTDQLPGKTLPGSPVRLLGLEVTSPRPELCTDLIDGPVAVLHGPAQLGARIQTPRGVAIL